MSSAMETSKRLPEKWAREVQLALLLIQRLERLSADSRWAHLASGYRGALLRSISALEDPSNRFESEGLTQLRELILEGFALLEKAAVDITDLNPLIDRENL